MITKNKVETCLVTGGAGFIGSHLCEKLLEEGSSVVCLDNFDSYYSSSIKKQNIKNLLQNPSFKFIKADVCNAKKINSIFKVHKPQYVAHLAALVGVRASMYDAATYINVNVNGTVNLLNASRDFGVKNFLLASTSSIYGAGSEIPFNEEESCNKPLAPYPASKKAAELIAYSYHNLFKMNIVALRFFTVYGPRVRPDMMSFSVIDKIVKGQEITLFDIVNMRRDWTYVDDVCSGVMSALKKPLGYEVINIGRGKPVLLTDFVKVVESIIGKKAKLKIVKTPLSEPTVTYANITKAKKLLGYKPKTSIKEGLEKTWQWYCQIKDSYLKFSS